MADSLINSCSLLQLETGTTPIALYSHLVPIAVFLIVGGFVFFRSRENKLKGIFSLFVGTFALWLVGDLITWVSANYYTIYAFWATLDFLEVAFFVLGTYFAALLVYGQKLPIALRVFFPVVLLAPLVITLTGQSTHEFNYAVCESFENESLTHYKLYSEVALLLLLVFLGSRIPKLSLPHKGPLYAIVASLFLFLGTFSLSSYLASVTYYYEFLFYGLLALPAFFIVLVYSITNFELFRVQAFGVQVLIYLILILVSAQYLFVTSTTNKVLVGITLLLTGVFGYLFQQSAIREIKLREQTERLAADLEETNKRQETLMHFVGHEVKGFLTKAQGAFASLSEGDYGQLSDGMKPLVTQALAETRTGVESVTALLKASNQKKGTISYQMTLLDLCALTKEQVEKARPAAEKKGLKLTFSYESTRATCTMTGDKAELGDHVLRNLIDNAVAYTPSGSIDVSLKRTNGHYVFAVKDTGVGITDEDKKRLFTEGGHGKDSQKINVHSTGYGLFIAKNIVEAHHGTIRAESEGQGKGTTFIVELPA